jgi:hypothetical protein
MACWPYPIIPWALLLDSPRSTIRVPTQLLNALVKSVYATPFQAWDYPSILLNKVFLVTNNIRMCASPEIDVSGLRGQSYFFKKSNFSIIVDYDVTFLHIMIFCYMFSRLIKKGLQSHSIKITNYNDLIKNLYVLSFTRSVWCIHQASVTNIISWGVN